MAWKGLLDRSISRISRFNPAIDPRYRLSGRAALQRSAIGSIIPNPMMHVGHDTRDSDLPRKVYSLMQTDIEQDNSTLAAPPSRENGDIVDNEPQVVSTPSSPQTRPPPYRDFRFAES